MGDGRIDFVVADVHQVTERSFATLRMTGRDTFRFLSISADKSAVRAINRRLQRICRSCYPQAWIDTHKSVTRELVSKCMNHMNGEHDRLYQVAISPEI